MNAFQTAVSSTRFNRLMFGLGAAIFVVGVVAFIFTRVGGSDNTSFAQEPGFLPKLPVNSKPLKNANGVTVKTFEQLDPQIRSTIRTFLATAVARKNLGQSWAVIAPSVKTGYTYKQWSTANALPIVPYPIADIEKVRYNLELASTKEIMVEVGVTPKPEAKMKPARFGLGLTPVGKGANKRWLVDYWMPRWTPVLPKD
jgi:hypothetical protein